MNIKEYLSTLPKEVIYYKPNPGNGGDAIIAYSTYQLFKILNINYKVVSESDDLANKIVLYAGGGNLVKEYDHCAIFVKKYHDKVKKLIILPHTINGHERLLRDLGENVVIICREKVSFEYVSKIVDGPKVLLMHDLAINLNANRILKENAKLPLYVNYNKVFLKQKLKNLKRGNIGNFFSTKLNCYRIDVEQTNIQIPKDNIDLSIAINFDPTMSSEVKVSQTTKALFNLLNKYEEINTNRLHICFAGALLGKKVNFSDNSYGKNRSIYHHTIQHKFPNVNWID